MATIASSTLSSRARVAPGARALSPSAAAPLAAAEQLSLAATEIASIAS